MRFFNARELAIYSEMAAIRVLQRRRTIRRVTAIATADGNEHQSEFPAGAARRGLRAQWRVVACPTNGTDLGLHALFL
jgi:hypothetical protein